MSDTKYRDRDGNIHDNRSDAEAANAKGPGVTEAAGHVFAAVLGPLIVLGIIGFFLQTLIKQYALYFFAVAGFLILGNLFTRLLRDKCLIPVSVLLLATVGTILFGKLIYYPNIIEPSTFTADYIVGEAAIHARRNGGGKELALVPEGEKVTVNGVGRDRKEFNITAKDGSTGWIPAAAFPEDANFPPDDIGGLMKRGIPIIGKRQQQRFSRDGLAPNSQRGRDRDFRNRIETVASYFRNSIYAADPSASLITFPDTEDADKYNDVWPLFFPVDGLTADMMNRAVQVNQPFPVTINAAHGNKSIPSSYKEFSGDVEMTLRYILYAPEATIIAFDPGDHEFADQFGSPYNEERDYFSSLVLKDLDTGETFPFDRGAEDGARDEYIYIFPPVTTRHFALVHEKPVTDKKGANTDVWDIPEVTIAANAPTMANDPYVVTQRRIDNFTGNGSNAITMRNTILYRKETPNERIADIPAGEIVTILERKLSYAYHLVRYKDMEGRVEFSILKE